MKSAEKNSKCEEVFDTVRKAIKESGLFSDEGINRFMSSLKNADAVLDLELITAFLIRDGMNRHSFNVVNSFVHQLPMRELRAVMG